MHQNNADNTYIYRNTAKPSPNGLGFWFGGKWMVRFEPIAVQHAGGMLLPPVQTLVATIIFATGKNANRIHHLQLYWTLATAVAFSQKSFAMKFSPQGKDIS